MGPYCLAQLDAVPVGVFRPVCACPGVPALLHPAVPCAPQTAGRARPCGDFQPVPGRPNKWQCNTCHLQVLGSRQCKARTCWYWYVPLQHWVALQQASLALMLQAEHPYCLGNDSIPVRCLPCTCCCSRCIIHTTWCNQTGYRMCTPTCAAGVHGCP